MGFPKLNWPKCELIVGPTPSFCSKQGSNLCRVARISWPTIGCQQKTSIEVVYLSVGPDEASLRSFG